MLLGSSKLWAVSFLWHLSASWPTELFFRSLWSCCGESARLSNFLFLVEVWREGVKTPSFLSLSISLSVSLSLSLSLIFATLYSLGQWNWPADANDQTCTKWMKWGLRRVLLPAISCDPGLSNVHQMTSVSQFHCPNLYLSPPPPPPPHTHTRSSWRVGVWSVCFDWREACLPSWCNRKHYGRISQRYRFESRWGQWALFSLTSSALSFVFLWHTQTLSLSLSKYILPSVSLLISCFFFCLQWCLKLYWSVHAALHSPTFPREWSCTWKGKITVRHSPEDLQSNGQNSILTTKTLRSRKTSLALCWTLVRKPAVNILGGVSLAFLLTFGFSLWGLGSPAQCKTFTKSTDLDRPVQLCWWKLCHVEPTNPQLIEVWVLRNFIRKVSAKRKKRKSPKKQAVLLEPSSMRMFGEVAMWPCQPWLP